VTIPSQQRYLGYYHQVLKNNLFSQPPPTRYITRLNVTTVPLTKKFGCEPNIKVNCKGRKVFRSAAQRVEKDMEGFVFHILPPIAVSADVNIIVQEGQKEKKVPPLFNPPPKIKLFSFAIDSQHRENSFTFGSTRVLFVVEVLSLPKSQLDKAFKDKKKTMSPNLQAELRFQLPFNGDLSTSQLPLPPLPSPISASRMLHSADSVRSPRGRHTDTDKDRESNPSPVSASRMLNSSDSVRSPRRHVDTEKEREREKDRDTNREREKEREGRDRERERERDRDRDRDREDRDKEGHERRSRGSTPENGRRSPSEKKNSHRDTKERDRDRDRVRDRDRERDKEREREKDRDTNRERDKDNNRDREREKEKEDGELRHNKERSKDKEKNKDTTSDNKQEWERKLSNALSRKEPPKTDPPKRRTHAAPRKTKSRGDLKMDMRDAIKKELLADKKYHEV